MENSVRQSQWSRNEYGRTGLVGCCSPANAREKETIVNTVPQPPTSADVLKLCLALDDVGLVWVCTKIFEVKAAVLRHLLVLNDSSGAQAADVTDSPDAPLAPEAQQQQQNVATTPRDSSKPIPSTPIAASMTRMESPGGEKSVVSKGRASTGLEGLFDKKATYEEMHLDALELRENIKNRDASRYGELSSDLTPTVQFETGVFYAAENMKELEIGIIRIGDVSQSSTVCFRTMDGSAKAGVKYVGNKGPVVFAPGDRLKTVIVHLLDDANWDAEREFLVELTEDGISNAVLGRYLWVSRVKLLDDDCFPSNQFAACIKALEFDSINLHWTMWDFFKMNLRNPTVRFGVVKTVMADLFENSYFLLGLFLNLYLVDFVLCKDTCDPDQAHSGLLLILILRLLPFPILHYLNYSEAFWKVGGATRLSLQVNLLRKYLSYDSSSLSRVDESRLVLALTRDSSELASDAFCMLPKIIAALSRLIMLVLYQILVPIALGEGAPSPQKALVRFVPSLIFPVCMVTFLRLRTHRTEMYCEYQHQAQNDMILHVRNTIASIDLVRDYKKRNYCIDAFEIKIEEFNKSMAESVAIFINNKMFPSWLSLLLLVGYTQIGGIQVASGGVPLGEFLNYLAIFAATGQLWGEIYGHLLSIQNSFDALETVVEYMNLPTEGEHRLAQFKISLDLYRAAKAERLAAKDKGLRADPVDEASIFLNNLSFKYANVGSIGGGLQDSSMIIPQGGFYAFVGPPSSGKGTILKLLGESIIPFVPGFERCCAGSGKLLLPPHLRSLHVSKEPMFTQETMLENLRLGVAMKSDDGRLERILSICRSLCLSEALIETISANELICNWTEVLSSTDLALLNIARAIIANPEILCFHKPALYLNSELSETMYAIMQNFVCNRGVGQDQSKFHMRRPRTCLVTARSVAGLAIKMVDAVFYVSPSTGIVRLPQHAIDHHAAFHGGDN